MIMKSKENLIAWLETMTDEQRARVGKLYADFVGVTLRADPVDALLAVDAMASSLRQQIEAADVVVAVIPNHRDVTADRHGSQ